MIINFLRCNYYKPLELKYIFFSSFSSITFIFFPLASIYLFLLFHSSFTFLFLLFALSLLLIFIHSLFHPLLRFLSIPSSFSRFSFPPFFPILFPLFYIPFHFLFLSQFFSSYLFPLLFLFPPFSLSILAYYFSLISFFPFVFQFFRISSVLPLSFLSPSIYLLSLLPHNLHLFSSSGFPFLYLIPLILPLFFLRVISLLPILPFFNPFSTFFFL